MQSLFLKKSVYHYFIYEVYNFLFVICNTYMLLEVHLCNLNSTYTLKPNNMKTKRPYSFIAAMLFIVPALSFGQAPTMGTVANFVLFSSNGAVSNTGISQVSISTK
jgi:hypothetical protein